MSSHEKAIEMILNGECGTFNPLLLECLVDIKDRLKEEMTTVSEERMGIPDSRRANAEFEGYEKTKEQFFRSMSEDLRKECPSRPSTTSAPALTRDIHLYPS